MANQVTVSAQQLPFLAQYRENHILINPASISVNYTHRNSGLSTGVLGRYQWLELPDAPRTQTAYGSYIWEDRNLAFGGFLINDQTGPIAFSGAYGQLAYVLELSSYGHRISGGLNLGLVQYRTRFDKLNFIDNTDPDIINHTQIYPDVGLGVYYHYDKYFYAGISVPQVLGLNLNVKTPDEQDFQIQRYQHGYFIMGGYFGIGESSFLEPATWVQYTPDAPLNINFSIRMLIALGYNFEMWFGTGYSLSNMGRFEFGFTLMDMRLFNAFDGLKMSISYDHTFANFAPQVAGAYELHIGYYIDI